jgi:hypothetical protein
MYEYVEYYIYLMDLWKVYETFSSFVEEYTVNSKYSETSIHRFRRGSEKETMDPGKQ